MKKQFIWLMTDSTSFQCLGCYGDPNMITPNLDAMASNGVRMERAYTCQPVCGPARSALFTGMYPHSNGSWGNCMPLGANVRTLGEYLSNQGFKCGYIGKWHLDGGDYFGNGICPQGWDTDYWYDMKNYLDELSEDERVYSRNCEASDDGIDEKFTFAYRVTQRALDFIDKHQNDDFLLVVSYDEPHDPALCPPPFNSLYNDYVRQDSPALHDDLTGKPALQRYWADCYHTQITDFTQPLPVSRRLLRCNTYVDDLMGRILREAAQKTPNALRMYTSDHGDGGNAHGLFAKGPCVYDEIARVPLIFDGPCIAKGKVYPHTISHIDLPATVMDYLTGHIPVCFQGQSLMPVLADGETPTGRPAFIEFNRYEVDHDGFGGFQPMRAVVTDRHKLAVNLLDSDEFYDEATDPHDLCNRIDDEALAAQRQALHDALLDWMNNTRDPFRGYQWRCRPWRAEFRPSWDNEGMTRQPENEPDQPRQLDYKTGLPMRVATRVKG